MALFSYLRSMNQDELYSTLREKAEQVAGRAMNTPRDFDFLATRILDKTKGYIAPITLKRFWGYLGDEYRKKPYRSTLNILAQFVGYVSIEAFEESHAGGSLMESDFLTNDSLQVASLEKGAHIELRWYPDRCVTVAYLGMEMFKVVESVNSKLSAGDTFMVSQIVDGEPLTLRCLVHEGMEPTNYVCGRVNGVKYRVI